MHEDLMSKLTDGSALIGVVGLGYVGLPLAHALRTSGYRVVGFDVDDRKVVMLRENRNYLKHLGNSLVEELNAGGGFTPTSKIQDLSHADAIIVCVPTPLGPHNEPDLSYVVDSARAIGAVMKPGALAALESTTYPGTTRGEFLSGILEGASAAGRELAPGRSLFVAYSPEREDPGRKSHSTRSIPKLVGGIDERSTALAMAMYGRCIQNVVQVESAEVAEAAKLLENIFRAVNIALVNEMKVVLTELGIDVWEVIRAASTKPFGFMPFYPGPGLGGHCIPIDPFYLSWKAKEAQRPCRFIELAGEVNTAMPNYVVERLILAMNDQGKAIRGSRVLVIGLAYKPDVDDTRESPAMHLIDRLSDLGARVSYHDPWVPEALPTRKYALGMKSVALTPEVVREHDVVLIATAHSDIDYGELARSARLVVDTRDAMREFSEQMGDRLVRA